MAKRIKLLKLRAEHVILTSDIAQPVKLIWKGVVNSKDWEMKKDDQSHWTQMHQK